jgi:hypothetical protein
MVTISRMYDNYSDAVATVHDLEDAGVAHDGISLVANADARGPATTPDTRPTHETHSGTGAATGAGIGAVLGGGAGLLAGIGALAIPGIGPVVATGWLVAALAGAGVGAASGGLIGALTGAGVSKDEAEVYDEGVRRGGSLLTVRVPDAEAPSVEAILARRPSADWRARRSEYQAAGWSPAR